MSRVRQLDALRGFALCGIVLGNVQWFSGYAVDPSPSKDMLGADSLVTLALHVFVDGKFYGLFSLLFGASFVLMLTGARNPADRARRRLLALGVIGLLHATVVWFGDILSLYALAAAPLWWLLRGSDRRVLGWSLGLMAAPIVVSVALLVHGSTGSSSALIYGPIEQVPAFAADSAFGLLRANAAFLVQRWILALVTGRLPRLLGLFLLGAWLVRRRPKPSVRAWALLLAVAAASNAALSLLADVPPLPGSSAAVGRSVLASVAIPSGALVYAGLGWAAFSNQHPLTRAFEAAGRLSLTHYLGQSLAMAALFYGVGGGLWGRLGATGSVVVGAGLAGLQVAVSPWLRARWGLGPGERLLRLLDRRVSVV